MPSLIILKGEITLHNLDWLNDQLLSALQDRGDVSFSCNNLDYLDTAAFQLLVSFKKSLENRSLIFQDVPREIIKMADLLGLTPFLKLGG